jgi:multidrug efflux pump subunit AcrA (membrane-fusion protein)
VSPAEDRVRAAVAELADALLAAALETAPVQRDNAPVELLSVVAFARRAGIGRSSAWLAVADGTVRTLKIRGRRVVPASELARLAESAS